MLQKKKQPSKTGEDGLELTILNFFPLKYWCFWKSLLLIHSCKDVMYQVSMRINGIYRHQRRFRIWESLRHARGARWSTTGGGWWVEFEVPNLWRWGIEAKCSDPSISNLLDIPGGCLGWLCPTVSMTKKVCLKDRDCRARHFFLFWKCPGMLMHGTWVKT